jgi:hypothetical protein
MSATLALDLGTRTGWALRLGSGAVEHGCVRFDPEGHEGEGFRFLRFRGWLTDLKNRRGPFTHMLYERVDFIVPGQAYAAHVWGGMWATATAWAEHHAIPYEGAAPSTIKKRVTGSGRSGKPAVIEALRKRGFDVRDHNEADAIALLIGCEDNAFRRAA